MLRISGSPWKIYINRHYGTIYINLHIQIDFDNKLLLIKLENISLNRRHCYGSFSMIFAISTFRHLWDGILPNLLSMVFIKNCVVSILVLFTQPRPLLCYDNKNYYLLYCDDNYFIGNYWTKFYF